MDNQGKRSQWFFINELMNRISEKVFRGDEILYKPTQVFTKYIQRKTKFSGIIYPSSKFEINRNRGRVEMEKCIVLFVDNKDCIEMEDSPNIKRVQLIMESEPKQYVYRR